jgi:hypothetical protein
MSEVAPVYWYWRKPGDVEPRGPVTESTLWDLADSGELHQNDMVWRQGLVGWVSARDVPDLFSTDGRLHTFIGRLGTAAANVVIVLAAGYLGLLVLAGLLLILQPIGPTSDAGRRVFEKGYAGYVTGWGVAVLLSFLSAFSGFSILGKLRQWRADRASRGR